MNKLSHYDQFKRCYLLFFSFLFQFALKIAARIPQGFGAPRKSHSIHNI